MTSEEGVVTAGGKLLPFGDAAIEAVLDAFVAELPQTARMLNCGALVHELVFGRDVDFEEDDLPQEGVYKYFDGLLDGLVARGVLQSVEDDEWKETAADGTETKIKVYSLSRESHMVYDAVRRAPLITTVPELVNEYAEGELCPAAADTIADLIAKRQSGDQ